MSGEVNWKLKYQELKSKYISSIDLAWRLGYEEGSKSAQQDQAQQQLAALQPGQDKALPDQSEQSPEQPEAPSQPSQQDPQGSELDKAITELESLLGKSEFTPEDLQKAMGTLKSLKQEQELKKSSEAIKGIVKALHKPAFKITQEMNHNLSNNAKASLNGQEKIVNDIFKAWAEQESKASKDIKNILEVEGLIKE